MSDETRDEAQPTPDEADRPRPRPRPSPSAEPEQAVSEPAASAVEDETKDVEASDVAATEPEPSEPEPSEPEASEPEASEPEASEPEASEPEAGEPEAGDGEASAVVPAEPAAPVSTSAASRARRIGGRPVVPAAAPAASVDLDNKRPTPPAPGTGRHVAAPPSAPAKKPAKIPKFPSRPAREPGPPSPTTVWIPAGVLGLAALVLIVFIAIASHGVYWSKSGVSSSSRNTTQQAALAAAKTCVAAINTYDYRKIPTAETAALACTTGKFTSDLKTVYEKTLKVEAPPAKATQTAQVNQAGIRDVGANGKQVDILIYGQLTLTNASTAASTPQYDPFGAIVTMDKVGGKWLVAKVAADVGGSVGS